MSTAENIFSNRLLQSVPQLTSSGILPSTVLNAGATSIETSYQQNKASSLMKRMDDLIVRI
jgi:hypothetical protein